MVRWTLKIAFRVLFVFAAFAGHAQYNTPVNYMSYLNSVDHDLEKDYMGYMSASAHGGGHRKLERRRKEVLTTLRQGIEKVKSLKPYEGNVALRDAYVQYLSILELILNEEYGKIVDMEAVAEESYDQMEAYLLAQERATEKLRMAADTLHHAYQNFATAHRVKLVESQSRISKKLKQTGAVMRYYNQAYLIYFKATKQEGYLVAEVNAENVNGIEQNRSTLAKYAREGLQKLTTIPPFGVDNSLVLACRKLLMFYQNEAADQGLARYLLKKDEFQKFRKVYEAKPAAQKTAAEVDRYNATVTDLNSSMTEYNKRNEEMNKARRALVSALTSAVRKFLDENVPN